MSLHEIHKDVHTHKKPKRLGRGIGSGQGKTAGKGHKGQIARAGWKALPIFQGGGSPLVRRVPKRGFTNIFAPTVAEINVGDLEELFEAGAIITPEVLESSGILKRRYDVFKVLGSGELTKKLSVSAHRFSAAAKEKIEKAGGTATVLPGKVTVAEKRAQAKAAKKK
ncbi:MAG: 50S ribosomal protein L15 [Pirellulaceae bacterium]|nr:50S ribosomal protein L15 [Pirellulaceae bacterium]